MKKLTTILTLTLLFLTACDNKKPNVNAVSEQSKQGLLVSNIFSAKVGDFIFDEEGRKYVKITNADEINKNGIYTAEIWERVDPLDKKRWYTPTLNSFVWTNQPVRFNSIFRMEGEDYPVF